MVSILLGSDRALARAMSVSEAAFKTARLLQRGLSGNP
jgi:hypothetical protein